MIKSTIFKIVGMILLAIVLSGAGFFLYKEFKTIVGNNAILQDSMEEQKKAVEQIQKDVKEITKVNKERTEQLNQLNNKLDNLEKRLSETPTGDLRDIGNLAMEKPVLMEKVFTNGTNDANRCFEILLGSPLTKEEKDADKKSEFNTMCPEIANPNYNGYVGVHNN